MRTERQKQASRVNGAKSRGPNTPEGKPASSRNAITRGLLAERFHALLTKLREELQPQTFVETSLVENMAVARWRQLRVWGLETAGVDHEMRIEAEMSAEEDTNDADAGAEGGVRVDNTTGAFFLGFRTLSDQSHSLELINRYDARYDRQYLRAHRPFLELVDRRTPPPVQSRVQHVPPAENLPQPPEPVFAKRTR